MYQGSLPPRSNRAGWIFVVEVTDDDTGQDVDLTGATIVLELHHAHPHRRWGTTLAATTANGKIVTAIGFFTATFTAIDMKTLCAETYAIGCTVSNADSEPQQLIIGTVPILDGIVSQ
jgi:hypothetical protein